MSKAELQLDDPSRILAQRCPNCEYPNAPQGWGFSPTPEGSCYRFNEEGKLVFNCKCNHCGLEFEIIHI